MSPAEVQTLMRSVNARWPHHPLPPECFPAWLEDLGEKTYAEAAAAVVVLSREGREFPPTCGQVRKRVDELTLGAPTFDEAWREMRECMARYGSNRSTTDLPFSNPLVRDLAQAMGWYEFGQTLAEDMPTFRAQARRMWETITARQYERLSFGDIPADLPGLRHDTGSASVGKLLASGLVGVDDGTAETLAAARDAASSPHAAPTPRDRRPVRHVRGRSTPGR